MLSLPDINNWDIYNISNKDNIFFCEINSSGTSNSNYSSNSSQLNSISNEMCEGNNNGKIVEFLKSNFDSENPKYNNDDYYDNFYN